MKEFNIKILEKYYYLLKKYVIKKCRKSKITMILKIKYYFGLMKKLFICL